MSETRRVPERRDHLFQLVPHGDRHQAVCRRCGSVSELERRGQAAAAGIVHWQEHRDDAA